MVWIPQNFNHISVTRLTDFETNYSRHHIKFFANTQNFWPLTFKIFAKPTVGWCILFNCFWSFFVEFRWKSHTHTLEYICLIRVSGTYIRTQIKELSLIRVCFCKDIVFKNLRYARYYTRRKIMEVSPPEVMNLLKLFVNNILRTHFSFYSWPSSLNEK